METVKSEVSVKWIESTLMAGRDSRGRPVVIGAKADDPNWVGLKASDLLLLAAASCSTYDVASILAKQRLSVNAIDVICSGEQMKEAPYSFVSIHLHYIVQGEIEKEKLEKAIQLSEEKYCSVITTLKGALQVTSDYEICDQEY